MDSKNFFSRLLTSITLILIFIYIINYLTSYLNLITFIIYALILYEIITFFKKKLLLIIYILISFTCIQLYLSYQFDLQLFVFFIMLIVVFDVFSYLFGSTLGKKKIMPSISPNKTYFGLCSGLFFSLIFTITYIYLYKTANLTNLLFLWIVVAFSTFLGDVLQSYFKRKSELKDSSTLLPGHGGFFDRFDGFIMSSISFYFYNLLVN